jgi:hypothetical protein
MVTVTPVLDEYAVARGRAPLSDTSGSAVSWPAVFAGAAASAALSLILIVLGTGLGLAAVSPWSGKGITAGSLALSTIIWIAFAALVSSGMGGYLAGRLRVKWPTVHTDEVYFRDTAHGFLAWAVATLVTAAVLSSAIGTIASFGTAAGTVAAGASRAMPMMSGQEQGPQPGMQRPGPEGGMQTAYMMDSLFRMPAGTQPAPATAAPMGDGNDGGPPMMGGKGEIGRIFANSMRTGSLPADDVHYAGQLVAQRTGLSQQDAEKRVTDTYNAAQAKLRDAEAKAKEAADQARKDATYASLWMFVSLLIGAFSASLMATIGGRRRDLY